MKKLIISAVLSSFLVACASDKPAMESENVVTPPNYAAIKAEPMPVPRSTPMAASDYSTEVDPLNDQYGVLAKRSIYFAYDVSAVQGADREVVRAHGQYLSSNSNRSVNVEGHADERGSNEYNLALGQRRADSVKKLLMLSGARHNQVTTVSFGEERPSVSGHNESAWSQNRRVDIRY